MRFSVITANYNGAAHLEQALCSVVSQRRTGVDVEYIVVDGNSTDGSLNILRQYEQDIDRMIIEADTGPANAINKGIRLATGTIVSWLNADDLYLPGTLARVAAAIASNPEAAFCFGACPIIDHRGQEIRRPITRFKESFFPIHGRFTLQCINYISQPTVFIRKHALERAGSLDETLTAAWDYALLLRLLREGRAVRVTGAPLAAFRWYPSSIGGRGYRVQFQEELDCALADAGPVSIQAALHRAVRWGIVSIYTAMERRRSRVESVRR